MIRTLTLAVLAALVGCSGVPRAPGGASPCAAAESSYACQVERYHDVAAQ